jgi:protein glucosyltransferase
MYVNYMHISSVEDLLNAPFLSFFGRPEINIKPWDALQEDLKDGNNRVRWMDREPYAYWKGNPSVSATRKELVKCNVSSTHDWNARIYAQVTCFCLLIFPSLQ